MKSRINVLSVSTFIICACISLAFSQIQLLSDSISCRTSAENNRWTKHFGTMKIYSIRDTALSVYNQYTGTSQYTAVMGQSISQSRYGIGGFFNGGGYGVMGVANQTGTTGYRYAGKFNSANGAGDYAVHATGTGYAGYFQGNVYVSGTFTNPSDEKLKTNIQTMTGSLSKVMQLKPKQFEFDQKNYAEMHFPKGKRYGFTAQDVEAVLPELVKQEVNAESDDKVVTFKSVEYMSLIPILVNAIQEQQKEIEELKNTIANIKK